MDELRVYVDALFARRGDTAENREMKEEIYGNLAARRDDLIAQGVPEAEAVRAAKAQLPSLDGVLGTVVRVNAQQWRTARLQSLLLASVILWVLTIPLLLVRGQISCLAAFVLAVVFGVWYLCSLRGESCVTMTVDAVQLRRQSRTVWLCSVRCRRERGAVFEQCLVFAPGAHRRAVCARRHGGAVLSRAEHGRVSDRGREISASDRAV